MRYWLSQYRDHNGSLSQEQSIRILWIDSTGHEHTACGDLRGASIVWTQDSGAAVPAKLADLAAECAIDAYEYGVEGCDFEGQETANEMWIAVEDAWNRQVRARDRRSLRAPKGHDKDGRDNWRAQ